MQPLNLLAKNFTNRQALDDYIKNEIGENIDANRIAGHTISGTVDELKVLSLSVNSRIYGVKIILIV